MLGKKKYKLLIASFILLLVAVFQVVNGVKFPDQGSVLSTQAKKEILEPDYTVTKVIDGDTIEIVISGRQEKIRVIGINTPETVDPRKEVECFGKEASDKAKLLLMGQIVRIENDPSQGGRDRYSRLLRYVFLPGDKDYGKEMIRDGFAYEYTYDTPYKYQSDYKKSQIEAQNAKKGLWGEMDCISAK